MNQKEQLSSEMKAFLQEQKWDTFIFEHMKEIEYVHPYNAWIFLYEKLQLKSFYKSRSDITSK
jgi:hypothetical protein